MFVFIIEAYDPMFPGKPNIYFYGLFYSAKKRRNVARFGPDAESALTISGQSKDWAMFVAEGVAQLYRRGIDTWVVDVTPNKNEKEPCLLMTRTRRY